MFSNRNTVIAEDTEDYKGGHFVQLISDILSLTLRTFLRSFLVLAPLSVSTARTHDRKITKRSDINKYIVLLIVGPKCTLAASHAAPDKSR